MRHSPSPPIAMSTPVRTVLFPYARPTLHTIARGTAGCNRTKLQNDCSAGRQLDQRQLEKS